MPSETLMMPTEKLSSSDDFGLSSCLDIVHAGEYPVETLGAKVLPTDGHCRHVELVRECESRQRQVHATRLLKCDAHVFNEMLDEKAGIEISFYDTTTQVVDRPR